jgi:hypothetical protein
MVTEAVLPDLQISWIFPMPPFDAEEGDPKKTDRLWGKTAILVGSKNDRIVPELVGVGISLA